MKKRDTPPQLPGVEPPLPQLGRPITLMRAAHGPGPVGATCGTCEHLYVVAYANRYYKCHRYGGGRSAASDFRLRWPACGLYTPETTS